MANLRVDKITSTETFEKTGSVQFDGDADYLEASNSDDFQLGTGDFTVEAWVLANDNSGSRQIISMSDGSENWQLFTHSGGTIRWNSKGTNDSGTIQHDADAKIDAKIWNHVAATRSGNTLRLFKNGIVVGTFGYNSDLTLSAGGPSIGIWDADKTSEDWQGHISNVRIIKGKALYTANFKPPMRELEVVPGTVLLACQSKTDATLEKTGKTLTVGGNAVASELTPGILTPIVKSGGGSAITGSVEFDGTGDYLSVQSSTDFDFGTGDFTIELYANLGNLTSRNIFARNDSNPSNTGILLWQNGSSQLQWYSSVGNTTGVITVTTPLTLHEWSHIAVSRESNTTRLFANGVLIGSVSDSTDISGDSALIVGSTFAGDGYYLKGFISNLRVVKGTALYTDDFIPPTRELKRVPGTVLLCCQDPNNPLTEATGKTITGYGNLQRADGPELVTNGYFDNGTTGWSVTGGAIVVTSGQLQLTNSNTTLGKVDQTITTVVGQIYQVSALITPDGGGHFPRLYVGADDFTPVLSSTNIQQLVTVIHTAVSTSTVISLNSNTNNANAVTLFDDVSAYDISYDADAPASNFTPQVGDDRQITFEGVTKINTDAYFYLPTGDTESRDKGAGTRGISLGGTNPSRTNIITFINISTTGNAQDFGDLLDKLNQNAAVSSSTRGISGGGVGTSPTENEIDTVNYITIASQGDAHDFGDLTVARRLLVGCSSQTRGIFAGGYDSPNKYNTMDYITIASTGDAIDFGDMVADGQTPSGRYSPAGYASPTRGVWHGGYGYPAYRNIIDYVTIASKGNTKDFGDSSIANYYMGGCSNSIRGISAGAYNPSPAHLNLIEYTTIATTGNAQDFGDLPQKMMGTGACASQIRGVILGGQIGGAYNNTMVYVTIMTMGNALDFGDLTTTMGFNAGCSNGHGGLG